MVEEKKGFFTKLKNFFKGEEKPVEVVEQIIEEKPEVKFEECFWCKDAIYEGQRYSKQQGRVFHKECYKKFLDAGRRGKL